MHRTRSVPPRPHRHVSPHYYTYTHADTSANTHVQEPEQYASSRRRTFGRSTISIWLTTGEFSRAANLVCRMNRRTCVYNYVCICMCKYIYIQGVWKFFAVPKCEGRLAQIKKESPILFCDIRNN